jgi:hypothetical protein|tara:strand:+ start:960 stop:1199 length:240 start_codon:yes stop_codon:yes gene_type:complete
MKFNEDLCMRQTYSLLLGKKTLEELMKRNKEVYLIFNPSREYITMDDDVYDTLIEYFTLTEEYEKCAELVEAKKLSLAE